MDKKKQITLFLKGMAMGAADVVPGVSGGTIAYITGIYQELVESIKSFDHTAIRAFRQGGVTGLVQHLNIVFLATLGAGIVTSIISLAKLISHLLETYPEVLWSFFFGLILASGVFVARQVGKWNWINIVLIVAGITIAWGVGELRPVEIEATPLNIFLAGSIAICAMILPGVSGSFLLLLCGMYAHVINAIKSLDLAFIATFGAGCAIGLMAFSHLLSWMFKKFFDATLAFLTGFLFGSLFLVWPWKQTTQTYINSSGEEAALTRVNVSPFEYAEATGLEPYFALSVVFMLLAIGLVFVLEKIAGHEERQPVEENNN